MTRFKNKQYLFLIAMCFCFIPQKVQAKNILILDQSHTNVDLKIRKHVINSIAIRLKEKEGLDIKVESIEQESESILKDIQNLLDQSRMFSEQFEENKAREKLKLAQQLYRENFGQIVEIEPLVQILLRRAKLEMETGNSAAAKDLLSKVATFDVKRRLDPGVYVPSLIRMFNVAKDRLAQNVGKIHVKSNPNNLSVWVDGHLRGNSPILLELPFGEHFVVVGAKRQTVGRTVILKDKSQEMLMINAPSAKELQDNELRNLGRKYGAILILTLKMRKVGKEYQLKLGLLPTTTVEVAKQVYSRPVIADRVAWVAGNLAQQLLAQNITEKKPEPIFVSQKSPSIFTRWWFWTAVAAVAGGSVTAALLATSDPGVALRLER